MWSEAQRVERERLWPGVEELLSGLPPSLSGQLKLLEYDLALRYSPSGQFRDIFLGADQFPLLSIASWLIEDLKLETGNEARTSRTASLPCCLLMAARTHAMRSVLDATSFYDAEHVACSSSCRSAWSPSCHGLFRLGRAPGRHKRRLRSTAWKRCSSRHRISTASFAARRAGGLTSMPAGPPGDCSPLAALTVGRRLERAPA